MSTPVETTPVSNGSSEAAILDLLADLPDPEIPVLTLQDLGIIRWARLAGKVATVGVAPTYSGCPATEVIEASVRRRLQQAGFEPRIEKVLSPPWTTDWITARGRARLKDYGITPPAEGSDSKRSLLGGPAPVIACPRCNSTRSVKVSEFGSTPCKASYKCGDCLEPFEYFKCI